MSKLSKQKHHLTEPVTHKDFQDYLEIASEVFATKEDIKNLANKSELIELKDEIITSNDKLVKKLDTFLTEQTMHTHSHSRQEKETEKIKDRVNRVEKHIGLRPATS